MRIAALSDLHYNKQSKGKLKDLLESASGEADVLLLCGDLTDHGTSEEAEILAEDLEAYVRCPMVGILGNHDFESGTPEQVMDSMQEAGVTMLDGEALEIDEIGFAGTAGFAGGFDRWALNPWGEKAIKSFVQASVDEALKLETALSRLQTDVRIVLLHYSPIRKTVEGESPEIFPFLGSSRLEDPLNHFEVDVAFHGHAHHGTPEGQTSRGIPVYNVSIPLLQRLGMDGPYRIFDTAETVKHTPS